MPPAERSPSAAKFSAAARRVGNAAAAVQGAGGSRKDAEVEIYILGEISHGENFKPLVNSRGVSCEVSVLLEGAQESQWQLLNKQAVAMTCAAGANKFETTQEVDPEGNILVWNHPLDLHYATSSLADWPRLRLRVLGSEGEGRPVPIAYGTAVLPCQPGPFALTVQTWRLEGTFWQELTGVTPLGIPDLAAVDTRAAALRGGLNTTSSGLIHIQGELILRKFENYGVNAGA